MTLRQMLAAGLLAQTGLLGGVARRTGLGRAGWLIGSASGIAVNAAVARGLRHSGAARPGPADVVTLTRAAMSCAVAALVADTLGRGQRSPALVPLSVGALVLDAVDGIVARRTGTASEFGARFDGEVDAFLILALSVPAARSFGWWVLAGGVARYAFGAAGWVQPWLRRPLPPRYWRKVATATEGIALTAAVSGIPPRRIAAAGLAAGLALIAESFGRDVLWLWRRRT